MFNVGFGEVVVVLVIFLITMEPSKFKEYLALIRFFYFKFHNLKREILDQIGFLEKPEKYILGDDGKKYESYDIDHMLKMHDGNDVADSVKKKDLDEDI